MAGPWSLDELAAVADETEDHLCRYVDAGLLHRRADGRLDTDSLHRLRLIQFAQSRGVTEDQLVAATAIQGDLLGIFGEVAPADDGTIDLLATAREVGLDDDVISELAEVLEWEEGQAGTDSDVAGLTVIAKALALGLPRDALMQLVRVFADAMDHLADAEVRTFHNYVHERFRARGLAGHQLLEATEDIGKPVLDLAEPALMYFHRRAYQRANQEDLLRHLAEDDIPPAVTPGEEQATVLFVDLASFTPLTATMGDDAAARVLRRFSITVRANATRHRGRIVKQIGDAFMLVFMQPEDAIQFGLAMDRFVDAEPQFPALHIGAHHGTVLYREGDYIGGTINLAARVASAGTAGQFLITAQLRDVAPGWPDVEFTSLPPRRLKGMPEPICLIEVRHRNLEPSNREADPVCGMLLGPNDVAARVTWRAMTFKFCSELCKQAFADNPLRFLAPEENTSP